MTAHTSPAHLDAADRLFRRPWRFVTSVPALDRLPPADRPEIAFAGRSNVGKSSLINAVVGNHGLAKTSNTPGRTQMLNFFEPDAAAAGRTAAGVSPGPLFLVDMPGYGFAEAPRSQVEGWNRLVRAYLRGRPNLARVLLLVDARHGVKLNDRAIMDLLDEAAVSYLVLLTKADKLGPDALQSMAERTGAELARRPAAFPQLITTSARDAVGIAEIRAAIFAAAFHDAPEAR